MSHKFFDVAKATATVTKSAHSGGALDRRLAS